MSKLKLISNFVTSKAGRQLLKVQKHSPVILFAAGVVGMVGTVVLASRATLKLEGVLEEHEKTMYLIDEAAEDHPQNYGADDQKKDKVLAHVKFGLSVAKLYAPAVVVGGLSVAALTGSHYILTQRNTALMAAYAAVQKGFEAYRKRVVAELGEEKDQQFRHGILEREIIEETKEGHVVTTIKEVDPNGVSIYAKFFDQHNRNWQREPEYNMIFLRAQQQYANDRLRAQGWLSLNDVYDSLGIDRTRAGQVVGWILSKSGDNYVDFGIFNKHSERARAFVNGMEAAIRLDFNVDGVILDLLTDSGCE